MREKYVYITITDKDGTVLDRFAVSHWTVDLPASVEDFENVGSNASNSMLAERIGRFVQKP